MSVRLRSLEAPLVTLVALHSYGVGAMLILAPAWAVRFAGWHGADPLFFPVQAGVFHLVLATGYLLEYRRSRGVSLLLLAKGTAFVFLMGAVIFSRVPWAVPFSGVADGLMGLAVALVHAGGRARGGGAPHPAGERRGSPVS